MRNLRLRGSHSKLGPASEQSCARCFPPGESHCLTAPGPSGEGGSQDHATEGAPAFHTPSGVSEPQTPPAPSPHPERRGGWLPRTVSFHLRTCSGCSQAAHGTSLHSQAPGQHEGQSKGNSRHGGGLSQLGCVHQGTSARGQPGRRVASVG